LKKIIVFAAIFALLLTGCAARPEDPGLHEMSVPDISDPSSLKYEDLDLFPVSAAEDFTTKFTPGGRKITHYDGSDKVVVIPETLNTEPVVEIGTCAFVDTDAVAIVLPGSVRRIEKMSFLRNSSLRFIRLNSGLQYIGDKAFDNCPCLEKCDIPDTVSELGESVFASDEALVEVHIPASVESIGGAIAENCPNIVVITSGGSVADTIARSSGITVKNES